MKLVKGFVVESVYTYAKDKHPEIVGLWLESLPKESKNIFSKAILPAEWYPVKEACIVPTKALAEVLDIDDKLLAWNAGRFSANQSLTGIYKVFLTICSPLFLIKRASVMLSSFYQQIDVKVLESSDSHMSVEFYNFSFKSEIVEHRIGGWMQVALEKAKCHEVEFEFLKSVTRGDDSTKLLIKWKN